MISVEEASNIIFSTLHTPGTTMASIHTAAGMILAEEILADRDFPPFDRVAMDGIAIQFAAWKNGSRDFRIEGTQAAGVPQQTLSNGQHCLEVMTGAVLPAGTDTVIRYEDVTIVNGQATILIDAIQEGQHVHHQGQDAKRKSLLLEPGLMLSPAEIALLASVGKSEVKVYAFPRTAIISSGDELVDITEAPQPHQIRRSNTYALEAGMEQLKWPGKQFHLPDQKDLLEESLQIIAANHDVMILSGGVSKGKFDFIPEVLQAIGIQKIFHQVNQRPGKPFWFGRSENGKIVFALPGNPVSTYMCFYRYVKPWLLKSFGVTLQPMQAMLASDFAFAPNLTYFLQVNVKYEQGKLIAYPQAGGGSGDFANLKNVSGFLELPADKSKFAAGEVFTYIPFRNLL